MAISRLFPVVFVLIAASVLSGYSSDPLIRIGTYRLPDIEGVIQHMAVDVKGKRLFIAATSHNSIEIYDAVSFKYLNRISGLAQPQDLAYVAATNRLLVTNGADGTLRTYDAITLKLLDSKFMGGDADRVRVSADGANTFVGYGAGGFALIDNQTGHRADVKLHTHPESFQVETKGTRIYVNLPGEQRIGVIDRPSQTLEASFPLPAGRDNISMALDEANRRLFVACRKPGKLVVLDTHYGDLITSMPAVNDAEDIFFDSARKRIYVVGGEGAVGIYREKQPNSFGYMGNVDTTEGARTGLFVPEWSRLFVVARDRPGDQAAELIVFSVED